MMMPGREFGSASSTYRYGFNGKEKDNKDGVVQYDYGFRIYDPRLVRFLSLDPLFKSYPFNSPYSYAEGDVIRSIDLDGLEKYVVTNYFNRFGQKEETLITTVSNKDNEPQEMNLVYSKGRGKGQSVAEGNNVLVRNVRENRDRKTFSTSYERKGALNEQESNIFQDKPKEGVKNSTDLNESFQPIVGDNSSNGIKIIGKLPGFNSSENKQFDQRQSNTITLPPPPTQTQLNTAALNVIAGIDPNSNTLSTASRNAANSLGNMLLSTNFNSATLDVKFFDPTGAASFNTRSALNGSTFGANVNTQIRNLTQIIQAVSGVNINFSGAQITTSLGTNGATLKPGP